MTPFGHTPTMIVIRPSTRDDIATIRDVEVDAGQMFRSVGLDTIADDDPPGSATIAEHLRRATAWTAELDASVVGYALSSVVDGQGHLDQISVRRAAAGQGIGRLLIDHVCRWASECGHDELTLTTFVDVPWNGPYYTRLGFRHLDDADCGPDLGAIREKERRAGIDVAPRTAMRLLLEHWVSPDLPPTADEGHLPLFRRQPQQPPSGPVRNRDRPGA